ncbi:MAG TPA: nucleotide exchange factor GrpE [Fimbriimonadales bacterium]|nr:nucleotide exchange factor GrpE [Fimbriimonadales bacterium]
MEQKEPEPKEPNDNLNEQITSEEENRNVNEEGAATAEHPPVNDLLSRIQQLENELTETRNMLKRAHSDVQNVHRRLVREAQLLREMAAEDIAKRLLPALDNLERTLQAAEFGASLEAIVEGVKIVERQIRDALEEHGVRPILAKGQPFDPRYHEAVASVEGNHEPGIVVEEIEKGYVIGEKVLRPSRVKVSKGQTP